MGDENSVEREVVGFSSEARDLNFRERIVQYYITKVRNNDGLITIPMNAPITLKGLSG